LSLALCVVVVGDPASATDEAIFAPLTTPLSIVHTVPDDETVISPLSPSLTPADGTVSIRRSVTEVIAPERVTTTAIGSDEAVKPDVLSETTPATVRST
jgi:formylmethanofuran dehydrogenase subunit E-like metal-binding protein